MTQNRHIVIGLTGNIGAGKNAVAEILEKNGAKIIDADETSRRIMQKGTDAYYEIIRIFGDFIDENGEIDRKTLAAAVFNDKKKLDTLVAITHKYIIEDNLNRLEEYKKDPNTHLIVLNAPLLFEAGMEKHTDVVWVVYADLQRRIQRVMQRDGISKEKVLERIKNQKDPSELLSRADAVIENDGSLEELQSRIRTLLQTLYNQ